MSLSLHLPYLFQFSSLRKVLLAIYLVVIILFVVAMVVIVVLAPIGTTFTELKSKIMN